MHQWRLSEPRGVSTQPGELPQRNSQARVCWSSRFKRGSIHLRLCPTRGAPLWTWLLLGLLVVPGAWSFLSEEQEELLVELHNHYRGQVSPSTSAMLPLKWDPNLKLIAEGYATKCIWNHNPELEDTGENLFAGTGPLDLREVLEKWFLEYLDYNFNNNSCDEDKMCGHYTQMVWAETHRVGCAFHLCNSMEGLGWQRVSFLVCNYYPAGNYEGERPYVEGDSCTRCPYNPLYCENNLCATSDPPDEGEEEEYFPPAATNDPYVQLTITPTSTPGITTNFIRFNPPPATSDTGKPLPEVNLTEINEEEEAEEEEMPKIIKGRINITTFTPASSASVSSPSALMASLMASLMAVFALRL